VTRAPSPGRLRHRVGATIAERDLWSAGDRVAVAVSGGLDSVCLLDLLVTTAAWHGAQLEVATVDHGTRAGSATDADFVEELARSRRLPVHRFTLALGADASEDACRVGRWGALDTLTADRIATAHHEEDQAETVLLRLLRGTGVRGLGGMTFRRGRVVRPLLDVPRRDLVAWARHRDLRWVEDPSNVDPRFLRNRIRHELLPLLEDLSPGSVHAVARTGRRVACDAELLEELATRSRSVADALAPSWLRSVPEGLALRVLGVALPDASLGQVEAVLRAVRQGGGAVLLGDGRRVAVTRDRVSVERSPPDRAEDDVEGG
jgi:tRNA(Ile)-lysidine synthase